MSTNFNIVKKKKQDEEEFFDEDEIEEEKEVKDTDNNVLKKRMIVFMGFILVGFLVLMIILFLVSTFSSHTYEYSDIELILKNAAVAYFKDYPENLPVNDGDIVEVDSSNLVYAGKMKDLSEYTKEGILCTGTVQVEKSGSEYLYSPYLSCGDDYSTVELAKKVAGDDGNIVTSGYGLYSMNGAYVFRGEDVKNYVKLGDTVWRIVKITSDNNIVLIHDTGLVYSNQPWDNRYNEKLSYSSGFNNYKTSRMKEYLDKIYDSPTEDEFLLDKDNLAKIVSFNLCIGKRSANSEGNANKEECAETFPNQKSGLLTLSDFMAASLDPNCKSANNKSCTNYNYLAKVKDWWLVTGNKDDDTTVFKVNNNGIITADTASTYSTVRPVIYLNSKVLYKDGKGTLDKPYEIK